MQQFYLDKNDAAGTVAVGLGNPKDKEIEKNRAQKIFLSVAILTEVVGAVVVLYAGLFKW